MSGETRQVPSAIEWGKILRTRVLQGMRSIISLGAREWTLPSGVLIASVASHALASWYLLSGDQSGRSGFLLLLTGVAAVLEVAGHSVHTLPRFRVIQVIRFVCLAVLLLVLRQGSLAAALLVSWAYPVETALFEKQRIAVIWSLAGLGVLVCTTLCAGLGGGLASTLTYAITYLLVTGPMTGLALLAIHHREENVHRQEEAAQLSATVDNLIQANMALQRYAHNVESESAEKERHRVTRELHDLIGYALTNVIVMVDAVPVLLRGEPESLPEHLGKIRAQAEEALAETRTILRRLREIQSFAPIGLKALAHLTRSFQEATGVAVVLNLGNLPWTLGHDLDSMLFRVIQEGLTNAFRHGKADLVRVNLWQTGKQILVSVLDNGCGLTGDSCLIEGIGLSGMRERLADFGGEIQLSNRVDGCELQASIPYGMERVSGGNQGTDRR